MATANANDWAVPSSRKVAGVRGEVSVVWKVAEAIGSLKLTVGLFALAMVIILVGTLAQEDLNMVEVKARYFTAWISWMRVEDLLPQAFIRHDPLPGVFPFPGGALIGVALLINLVAAKVTRFPLRAKGARLAAGAITFAFGLALCWGVVAAAHSTDGVQGEPPISYDTMWRLLVAGMAVLWMTTVYKAITADRQGWKYIWGGIAIPFGVLGLAALLGYFEMAASSMRITWQLLQGTVVAAVLLVGSNLMFAKQGGNLLLHFGVALLMIGQFAFGDTQSEQRLSLVEGQATNVFVNMDRVELVFVDRSEAGKEIVTAVPEAKLQRSASTGAVIKDDRLPVDVKVLELYSNSTLVGVGGENGTLENLATVGSGLDAVAKPRAPSGGVDSAVDIASAYVEFLHKQTGESLGVHLVTQMLADSDFLTLGERPDVFEKVEAGENPYDVGLRFARVPKPYWVKVDDVRRVQYSGTETPRDYSSYLTLVDSETGEVRDERVWMNNPLRYRGETFYQSNYEQLPSGKEYTSIQVVRNVGWMIPYLACMIVAVGMVSHFTGTLDRFLGRREREGARLPIETRPLRLSVAAVAVLWAAPTGLLALTSLVPWSTVMMALRPESRQQEMDLYRAGEIPVRYGGRVMPLDAFARQTLRAVSNRTSLPLEADEGEAPPAPGTIVSRAENADKLSALQWLIEMANGQPEIRELQMFRIDADEVLNEFEIDRRPSKLYSLAELAPKLADFDRAIKEARAKDALDQTFRDKKLIELGSRLSTFQMVDSAFGSPPIPEVPDVFQGQTLTPQQKMQAQVMILRQQMEALKESTVPAIIPPTVEVTTASQDVPPWSPLSAASFFSAIASMSGEPPTPGVATFTDMLTSYQEKDAAAFNEAVDQHLKVVQEVQPRDYSASRVGLERWLEAVQPTLIARLMYGVFIVLALFGLMVNMPRLQWGIWGGLAAVAVIHTFVLMARTYITGRAPVINLYSSAVFIGWATVLFGLLLELIFRRGIGNIIAATTGLLSLMVAWMLNTGDTMPVLQAVLDTQFWLATHVISVTLGYSATFLAGALGIVYLVRWGAGRFIRHRFEQPNTMLHDVYRMAYSATCFGILFSFVGTVLGGLWADDSWGRFWGWDPKENGALLIVIWNALMLHARWDGMVRERGFAILAIGGNIVTAWSWFGTNQLGIGLHSYGFTSGALLLLTLFVASQLLLIVLGVVMLLVPRADKDAT